MRVVCGRHMIELYFQGGVWCSCQCTANFDRAGNRHSGLHPVRGWRVPQLTTAFIDLVYYSSYISFFRVGGYQSFGPFSTNPRP